VSNKKSIKTAMKASTLLIALLALLQPAMADTTNPVEDPSGKPNEDVKQTTTPTVTASPKDPAGARPLRVGLALGGGGTRGAAHVGVLRVLQREGIPINAIAGTSMGAIVGGLYAAGVSVDALQQKFDDRSLMTHFMTVPLSVRVVVAPVMVVPRAFGHHAYDGLYKGGKFRKYLDASVPQFEQNIEELKIPFAAVALDVVDGKPYRLSKGNLGYALQASSAVPGLRKPVQIGDQLFVDGGVVENVPVDEARAMGSDIVIAVDVDERFDPVPLDTFRAMGSMAKRMVALQLANVDAPQLKHADIVIHPMVDGIGLISTKADDAKRAMKAGEKAAEEALPAIKAKLSQMGIALVAPDALKTVSSVASTKSITTTKSTTTTKSSATTAAVNTSSSD
jgi:NTE family protein